MLEATQASSFHHVYTLQLYMSEFGKLWQVGWGRVAPDHRTVRWPGRVRSNTAATGPTGPTRSAPDTIPGTIPGTSIPGMIIQQQHVLSDLAGDALDDDAELEAVVAADVAQSRRRVADEHVNISASTWEPSMLQSQLNDAVRHSRHAEPSPCLGDYVGTGQSKGAPATTEYLGDLLPIDPHPQLSIRNLDTGALLSMEEVNCALLPALTLLPTSPTPSFACSGSLNDRSPTSCPSVRFQQLSFPRPFAPNALSSAHGASTQLDAIAAAEEAAEREERSDSTYAAIASYCEAARLLRRLLLLKSDSASMNKAELRARLRRLNGRIASLEQDTFALGPVAGETYVIDGTKGEELAVNAPQASGQWLASGRRSRLARWEMGSPRTVANGDGNWERWSTLQRCATNVSMEMTTLRIHRRASERRRLQRLTFRTATAGLRTSLAEARHDAQVCSKACHGLAGWADASCQREGLAALHIQARWRLCCLRGEIWYWSLLCRAAHYMDAVEARAAVQIQRQARQWMARRAWAAARIQRQSRRIHWQQQRPLLA